MQNSATRKIRKRNERRIINEGYRLARDLPYQPPNARFGTNLPYEEHHYIDPSTGKNIVFKTRKAKEDYIASQAWLENRRLAHIQDLAAAVRNPGAVAPGRAPVPALRQAFAPIRNPTPVPVNPVPVNPVPVNPQPRLARPHAPVDAAVAQFLRLLNWEPVRGNIDFTQANYSVPMDQQPYYSMPREVYNGISVTDILTNPQYGVVDRSGRWLADYPHYTSPQAICAYKVEIQLIENNRRAVADDFYLLRIPGPITVEGEPFTAGLYLMKPWIDPAISEYDYEGNHFSHELLRVPQALNEFYRLRVQRPRRRLFGFQLGTDGQPPPLTWVDDDYFGPPPAPPTDGPTPRPPFAGPTGGPSDDNDDDDDGDDDGQDQPQEDEPPQQQQQQQQQPPPQQPQVVIPRYILPGEQPPQLGNPQPGVPLGPYDDDNMDQDSGDETIELNDLAEDIPPLPEHVLTVPDAPTTRPTGNVLPPINFPPMQPFTQLPTGENEPRARVRNLGDGKLSLPIGARHIAPAMIEKRRPNLVNTPREPEPSQVAGPVCFTENYDDTVRQHQEDDYNRNTTLNEQEQRILTEARAHRRTAPVQRNAYDIQLDEERRQPIEPLANPIEEAQKQEYKHEGVSDMELGFMTTLQDVLSAAGLMVTSRNTNLETITEVLYAEYHHQSGSDSDDPEDFYRWFLDNMDYFYHINTEWREMLMKFARYMTQFGINPGDTDRVLEFLREFPDFELKSLLSNMNKDTPEEWITTCAVHLYFMMRFGGRPSTHIIATTASRRGPAAAAARHEIPQSYPAPDEVPINLDPLRQEPATPLARVPQPTLNTTGSRVITKQPAERTTYEQLKELYEAYAAAPDTREEEEKLQKQQEQEEQRKEEQERREIQQMQEDVDRLKAETEAQRIQQEEEKERAAERERKRVRAEADARVALINAESEAQTRLIAANAAAAAAATEAAARTAAAAAEARAAEAEAAAQARALEAAETARREAERRQERLQDEERQARKREKDRAEELTVQNNTELRRLEEMRAERQSREDHLIREHNLRERQIAAEIQLRHNEAQNQFLLLKTQEEKLEHNRQQKEERRREREEKQRRMDDYHRQQDERIKKEKEDEEAEKRRLERLRTAQQELDISVAKKRKVEQAELVNIKEAKHEAEKEERRLQRKQAKAAAKAAEARAAEEREKKEAAKAEAEAKAALAEAQEAAARTAAAAAAAAAAAVSTPPLDTEINIDKTERPTRRERPPPPPSRRTLQEQGPMPANRKHRVSDDDDDDDDDDDVVASARKKVLEKGAERAAQRAAAHETSMQPTAGPAEPDQPPAVVKTKVTSMRSVEPAVDKPSPHRLKEPRLTRYETVEEKTKRMNKWVRDEGERARERDRSEDDIPGPIVLEAGQDMRPNRAALHSALERVAAQPAAAAAAAATNLSNPYQNAALGTHTVIDDTDMRPNYRAFLEQHPGDFDRPALPSHASSNSREGVDNFLTRTPQQRAEHIRRQLSSGSKGYATAIGTVHDILETGARAEGVRGPMGVATHNVRESDLNWLANIMAIEGYYKVDATWRNIRDPTKPVTLTDITNKIKEHQFSIGEWRDLQRRLMKP